MPEALPPLIIADANVLVKDVVSATFFDLNAAGLISLHWTPEIETEYIRHRGRIRAEKDHLSGARIEDLLWAGARIEINKRHLVPDALPVGWIQERTLVTMMSDSRFARLLTLPDPDDIHVALAAVFLADSLKRPVILATHNLNDFPQTDLMPFNIIVLHPGDILEALYRKQPKKISTSLMKTCQDFKNPIFNPDDFLRSISAANQFDNPDLASLIKADWNKQA